MYRGVHAKYSLAKIFSTLKTLLFVFFALFPSRNFFLFLYHCFSVCNLPFFPLAILKIFSLPLVLSN